MLAHEAASLDHLSGGRFELGIGAGWNLEEMRNHGTDPSRALRVMRERVLAMREIWTQDEASFHGEFVDFDRIWSWPKPVQQPAAGVGRRHRPARARPRARVRRRLVSRTCATSTSSPTRIAELQRRAADAGRERIPITYFGAARSRRREAREDGRRRRRPRAAHAPAGAAPTRPCRASSATRSSPRATADGRGALPRAPGGRARRPPRHGAARRAPARRRLLLRGAGRPAVDGGRRQAEDDHPRCSAWTTCAPTRGRACSSTTTRRTGTRCGGSAPTGPPTVLAEGEEHEAALAALVAKYRAVRGGAAARGGHRGGGRALAGVVGAAARDARPLALCGRCAARTASSREGSERWAGRGRAPWRVGAHRANVSGFVPLWQQTRHSSRDGTRRAFVGHSPTNSPLVRRRAPTRQGRRPRSDHRDLASPR